MKKEITLLGTILALFLFGCTSSDKLEQTKKIMGKWHEKAVIMPTEMEYLNPDVVPKKNNVNLNQLENGSNSYIIHYFDAGCDKCVNELANAKKVITEHFNGSKVKFIFIADARNNFYAKQAIKNLEFDYPVFYEKQNNELQVLNNFPLGDKLYHTFLMDSNKRLVLFGSFFDNEKARNLVKSIL